MKEEKKQAHSIIGGSTANILLGCPASNKLLNKIQKKFGNLDRGSEAAERGTRLHKIMEEIVDAPLHDWSDKVVEFVANGSTPNGVKVFVDDSEALDIATSRLYSVIIKYFSHLPAREIKSSLDAEVRVTYPHIPDAFGTCDIVAHSKTKLLIVDFKFGFYEVKQEANTQLMFYLAGAIARHKEIWGVVPKSLYISIIQPSASEYEPIAVTKQEVKTFNLKMKKAFQASLRKNAEANEDLHCKWAKCQMFCPSKLARAADVLKQASTMAGVSTKKISLVAHALPFLKEWIAKVEEGMSILADKNAPIEGMVISTKSRKTKHYIGGEEEAASRLEEILGEDYPRLLTLPTPAQLEKQAKRQGISFDLGEVIEIKNNITNKYEAKLSSEDYYPSLTNLSEALQLIKNK